MNLPFELHIALRYLVARRRQAFISVISLISTVGVAVGVMALVVALALMTGLQRELRDRLLGSTAHVYVWKQGGLADYRAEVARLRAIPHVVGAAPAVLGKALITSGGSEAFVTLKGVDPRLEPDVTAIGSAMTAGRLSDLGASGEAETPGVLLGQDLAQQLAVRVGDSITVLTPQGTLSPMGMIPRSRRLRVAGTFRFGLFEFDSAYGMVALDVAERLVNRSDPELIELRVDDIYAAPRIAESVVSALGSRYVVQDWTEMNRSLFSALTLEKMVISITIGLIVMVAALNIVASLVLLVMEKGPDIAILKTMGAPARSIMTVFMLEGLIIGLSGTAVGGLGGWALSWVLDRYQLVRIPMDIYQVSHVPFVVQGSDFLVVITLALLICFVATIYPSRQAARLDPAEALRYG